ARHGDEGAAVGANTFILSREDGEGSGAHLRTWPLDPCASRKDKLLNIDDAYRYCRAIAHKYGANFSVGFRFLPRRKRRAVYAAYAFCRWADDIVDEKNHASTLEEWQAELDAAYAGRPTHPITIALADSLRFFQIPKSAFVA